MQPNEDILFGVITDTRLSWKRVDRKEAFHLSIMNFQVDNQTEYDPKYESCVLALRPSLKEAAIIVYVEHTITTGKALLCIDQMRIDVKPIAVRVTDTLLLKLVQFASLFVGNTIQVTEVHTKCPSAGRLYRQSPANIDLLATRVIL